MAWPSSSRPSFAQDINAGRMKNYALPASIEAARHKSAYNPDQEPRMYSFPVMAWPSSSRPSFAQDVNEGRTTNYVWPASTDVAPVCATKKILTSRSTTEEQSDLAANASSAQKALESECLLLLDFRRRAYMESRKSGFSY